MEIFDKSIKKLYHISGGRLSDESPGVDGEGKRARNLFIILALFVVFEI